MADVLRAVVAAHPLAVGVAVTTVCAALIVTGFAVWLGFTARPKADAAVVAPAGATVADPAALPADVEAGAPTTDAPTSPAAWAGGHRDPEDARNPLLSPVSVFVRKLKAMRGGSAGPPRGGGGGGAGAAAAPPPEGDDEPPAPAPARTLFSSDKASSVPSVSAPGSDDGHGGGAPASIPAAWPAHQGQAGLRSPARPSGPPPTGRDLASSPFWSPSAKKAAAEARARAMTDGSGGGGGA